MNWYPLLGLLALVYAGLVVFIALKKPEKIWNMGKIQLFIKVLGEKGTEIFFYVFAVVFLGLGIWLFTL
jgi:hypothetical protein